MKKVNYLNNRDLLEEIHKSKNSYSSYAQPNHHQYDIILNDLNEIDSQIIAEAKENKVKRLNKSQSPEIPYTINDITTKELIFRIMTFDHIPDDHSRKKNPKKEADTKAKVNFPPFQHWKYNDDGVLQCVGKSHWVGDLDTGEFSRDHGNATQKLAHMWMKLCEKYATKGNVRGYSYNDEMRGQAILQLVQVGLQFDESKSNNPFSYYTSTVVNSFIRVINNEKKNQNIRDDILEMNDLMPSYTRQHENEWEQCLERNNENRSDT